MNPTTIKWIDRRVGVLVCRILSLLNLFSRKKKANFPSKRLVFIKLIEQGASVLAYSALKEAVDKYGKEQVYFLVFKENRPILDLLEVLKPENIIEIDNTNFFRFLNDTLKALYRLRRNKVDSSIDMEFFSRASAIIAHLSGAKKRVGLYSFTSEHPYRGNLITHKIHYNPYVHVSQYYLMLMQALDEKPVDEPLLKKPIESYKTLLPKVKFEEEKLDKLRLKLGIPEASHVFVFNPNASDMLPLRRWDPENFRVLLDKMLLNYPQACFIFTGVDQEKGKISELLKGIETSRVINAAGKTSLMELMMIYQLSDLVLTNDSGPGHFASMFPTQVLVLFGPETPKLFAPKGDHVHVIYKNLACSPCVNVFNHRFSPCKDNVCMKNISVDEVYDKIKEIVNG